MENKEILKYWNGIVFFGKGGKAGHMYLMLQTVIYSSKVGKRRKSDIKTDKD